MGYSISQNKNIRATKKPRGKGGMYRKQKAVPVRHREG